MQALTVSGYWERRISSADCLKKSPPETWRELPVNKRVGGASYSAIRAVHGRGNVVFCGYWAYY